jgi:perosamine synthetase
MLAEYTRAKYVVAVVNGTAALHIALKLAKVQVNDEVIVPALSFVATANAVAHCGAVPHFVDSHLDTMGMDPSALAEHLRAIAEHTHQGLRNRRTGRRIAAIMPMHAFGHPVNMEPLLEIANRYSLPVVEDAAESLGSTYHNQHTGTFGKFGTLSFNGNKIITTGGGGAILTDDAELARHAKHITTTAKRPHRWEFFHDEVAWNYRLPNLNAAIGCAQMERLPDFLLRKRALAARYLANFKNFSDIQFVSEPTGCRSNYWLSTVRLEQPDMNTRDRLLTTVNNAGYQCRPSWVLLNKLPMYVDCPCAPLPVAERLEESLINLPSSAKLADRMP